MTAKPVNAGATRPLWRTYLAFLGPMVLANILQSLSGSVNAVYIGQMLGTAALAAVAGMFPVVFFFIALVIGVGAGASVLIGQAWGAREPRKAKAIAGTALALGGLIGLGIAALIMPAVSAASGGMIQLPGVMPETWLRGLLLMLAIGVIVGLLPALRGMRLNIVDALAGR